MSGNDVFAKFQENKSSKPSRARYGAAELLFIMVARNKKKSVSEIAGMIGRSKNSVQYTLNVILPGNNKKTTPKVKSVAEIFTYAGEEIPKDITVENHANTIVDAFKTSKSIILD